MPREARRRGCQAFSVTPKVRGLPSPSVFDCHLPQSERLLQPSPLGKGDRLRWMRCPTHEALQTTHPSFAPQNPPSLAREGYVCPSPQARPLRIAVRGCHNPSASSLGTSLYTREAKSSSVIVNASGCCYAQCGGRIFSTEGLSTQRLLSVIPRLVSGSTRDFFCFFLRLLAR